MNLYDLTLALNEIEILRSENHKVRFVFEHLVSFRNEEIVIKDLMNSSVPTGYRKVIINFSFENDIVYIKMYKQRSVILKLASKEKQIKLKNISQKRRIEVKICF